MTNNIGRKIDNNKITAEKVKEFVATYQQMHSNFKLAPGVTYKAAAASIRKYMKENNMKKFDIVDFVIMVES